MILNCSKKHVCKSTQNQTSNFVFVEFLKTASLSDTATALSELILKIDLVAAEGQQNNVLYQSIEIGARFNIGDVVQPNILVSLCLPNF